MDRATRRETAKSIEKAVKRVSGIATLSGNDQIGELTMFHLQLDNLLTGAGAEPLSIIQGHIGAIGLAAIKIPEDQQGHAISFIRDEVEFIIKRIEESAMSEDVTSH